MNTMILQVPVDRQVKLSAQIVAQDQGFSSLQDAVRLFLANLAGRKISATFSAVEPDEVLKLKEANVLARKYKQAIRELESGKLKTYTSAADFISDLKS
jgi:antitoxin component of RelBE/YafQ-DinJ toxin-antitoxin module